jgi:hypothetical protein
MPAPLRRNHQGRSQRSMSHARRRLADLSTSNAISPLGADPNRSMCSVTPQPFCGRGRSR